MEPNEFPPVIQASLVPSPINGVVPPVAARFKPGQSGNPAGRPNAGASIREWANVLVSQDLDEDEIRRIAKDKRTPSAKRIAAVRILRNFEMPDIADFEPVLDGTKTLQQMRAEGVNTEVLKKVKTKRRTLPGPVPIEEVEREIELRDTGLKESEFLVHETDGQPEQEINVKGLPAVIVFGAAQDGAFELPPTALPGGTDVP